jgi:hypothetical protein
VERSFSTADSKSLREATKPVDSLRVTTTTGGQNTETSLLSAVDSYRSRQHYPFAAETKRYPLLPTLLHHRYRKPQAAHSNHYRINTVYKHIRPSTAACGTHIQYSFHMLKHKEEEQEERIYIKAPLLNRIISAHRGKSLAIRMRIAHKKETDITESGFPPGNSY